MTLPLILPPLGGCGDYGSTIEYSALFDTGFLTFTPSVSGNSNTWSVSVWVKRSTRIIDTVNQDMLFSYGGSEPGIMRGYFYQNRLSVVDSESNEGLRASQSLMNDSANYMHVYIEFDNTQAADVDRVRMWVNGIQITQFSTSNAFIISKVLQVMQSGQIQRIGSRGDSQDSRMYMADYIHRDGIVGTGPVDFGYFNNENIWVPKAFSGKGQGAAAYGALGFHLDFSDPLDLGKDISGNDNHFTVSGGVTQSINTPTNSLPTWEPNAPNLTGTFTKGATEWVTNYDAYYVYAMSTAVIPSNMKPVWIEILTGGNFTAVNNAGIGLIASYFVGESNPSPGIDIPQIHWSSNGNVYVGSTLIATVDTWVNGDAVALGYTPYTGAVELFKNGVFVDAFTIPTGITYKVFAYDGSYTSTCTFTLNIENPTYSYPSEYQILSARTYPCPAILNPDDYVTVRYRDGGAAVKNLPWSPLIHKTVVLTKRLDANGDAQLATTLSSGASAKSITLNNTDVVDEAPYQISFNGKGYTHCQPDLHSNYMDFQGTQSFSRTQVAPDNSNVWTFSCWLRLKNTGDSITFLESGETAADYEQLIYNIAEDTLSYSMTVGNTTTTQLDNSNQFSDYAPWHHIVFTRNGNLLSAYVNNVAYLDAVDLGSDPLGSTNVDSISQYLGRSVPATSDQFMVGIMADAHFLDGVAALPTDFAYNNAGVWTPKEYTGLYGNNGWNLDFSDPDNLGFDSSGNDNHFTPSAGVTSANHLLEAYSTDPDVSGSRVDMIFRCSAKSGLDVVEVDHTTGVDTTFNHMLGKTVDYAWVFNLDTGTIKRIHHHLLPAGGYIGMPAPSPGQGIQAGWFESTAQDATLGAALPTGRYLVFMATAVAQLSMFPLYRGTGSVNGPMLQADFLPRIFGTYGTANTRVSRMFVTRDDNDINEHFTLSDFTPLEIGSTFVVSALSNGTKLRTAAADYNTSGELFAAFMFAAQPGKFARAMGLIQELDDEAGAALPYVCADTGAAIQHSALMEGDTPQFSRTFSTTGNRKRWTLSFWIKDTMVSSTFIALQRYIDDPNNTSIYLRTDLAGVVNFVDQLSNVVRTNFLTTAETLDPAAWRHCMIVADTAQADSTLRLRVYSNGLLQPNNGNIPAQDHEFYINTAGDHRIRWESYIAEYVFLDGIAATPTDFGYFNEQMHWVPRIYAGPYGANGFRLNFADAVDLGKDVSGNNNHWGVTSGTIYRSNDTPTHNLQIGNPLTVRLQDGGSTLSTVPPDEGRLYMPGSSASLGYQWMTFSLSIPREGNFYCECEVGIIGGADNAAIIIGGASVAFAVLPPDLVLTADTTYGFAITPTHIYISVDGVWTIGDPVAKTGGVPRTSNEGYIADESGDPGRYTQIRMRFDDDSFEYSAPGGYESMATDNFKCPTIINPDNYFTVRNRVSEAQVADLPWNTELYKTLVLTKRTDASGNNWRLTTTILGQDISVPLNATAVASNVDGEIFFKSDGYSYLRDDPFPQACKFSGAQYLQRTPSVTSNRRLITISTWLRRDQLTGAWQSICGRTETISSDSDFFQLAFTGGNDITTQLHTATVFDGNITTDKVIDSLSEWYHIHLIIDTENADPALRHRLAINGVVASTTVANQIAQNTDMWVNIASIPFTVGINADTSSWGDGLRAYMGEFVLIDGDAVAVSEFGETVDGVWIPKAFAGVGSGAAVYGVNGFHLDFALPGNLGNDISGNGNHLTPSGLSSSDHYTTTPISDPEVAGTCVDYIWRASRTSGMDILEIDHTTGSDTVVNHAAGGVIEYGWIINLDTGLKRAYSPYIPVGQYINLYDDSLPGTDTGWFASTVNTVTLGGTLPTGKYLVVVWRSVAGFSYFGTHDGLGSTGNLGAFIHTDFTPRLWMARPYESTTLLHLMDGDSNKFNPISKLYPMNTGAVINEGVGHFVSNGVKMRNNSFNQLNIAVLDALWAEVPSKFARAR